MGIAEMPNRMVYDLKFETHIVDYRLSFLVALPLNGAGYDS